MVLKHGRNGDLCDMTKYNIVYISTHACTYIVYVCVLLSICNLTLCIVNVLYIANSLCIIQLLMVTSLLL